MVKNTNGGKHKGVARKFVRSNDANVARTRVAKDAGEVYAQVTKRFGGAICEVVLQDERRMQCHIRGKFSGRFKRSNAVVVGTFVLVGMREWERSGQEKNVDLLHVYLPHDVNHLQTLHPFFFRSEGVGGGGGGGGVGVGGGGAAVDDDVIFSLTAPSESLIHHHPPGAGAQSEIVDMDNIADIFDAI